MHTANKIRRKFNLQSLSATFTYNTYAVCQHLKTFYQHKNDTSQLLTRFIGNGQTNNRKLPLHKSFFIEFYSNHANSNSNV